MLRHAETVLMGINITQECCNQIVFNKKDDNVKPTDINNYVKQ